jgi:hypothetical protein
VTYNVSRANATAAKDPLSDFVSLTYSDGAGGIIQKNVVPPFSNTFIVRTGDFLYISAQASDTGGNITTSITANTKLLKTTTSSGPFNIATASGSCC